MSLIRRSPSGRTFYYTNNSFDAQRPASSENEIYVGGFGVKILEHSDDMIDRIDFAIGLLQIEEDAFFAFYSHWKTYQLGETVTNFTIKRPEYSYISTINVTAVGRGLDKDTILTYTYAQMTQTLRWLAQVVQPYRRCKFQYIILWKDPPKIEPRWEAVAEGVYEPFINLRQTRPPTVSINEPGLIA